MTVVYALGLLALAMGLVAPALYDAGALFGSRRSFDRSRPDAFPVRGRGRVEVPRGAGPGADSDDHPGAVPDSDAGPDRDGDPGAVPGAVSHCYRHQVPCRLLGYAGAGAHICGDSGA